MSHSAYLVDWREFQKTLKETRSYDVALRPYEYECVGDSDESDNSVIATVWTKLRDRLNPPWAAAFENIFSFHFADLSGIDPCLSLERKENYEGLDRSWVVKKCSPEEVKALLVPWKEIRFKPLLHKVPKKLRACYIDMAQCVIEWKRIFKKAAKEKKGLVICFEWDH